MKTRISALPLAIGALLCLPASVMAQDDNNSAVAPNADATQEVAASNQQNEANAGSKSNDQSDKSDKNDPYSEISYYASDEERLALVKARWNKANEEESDADKAAKSGDADKTADADKAADAAEDEEEKDDKPWSVNATIAFDLGLGAFVKNEYARKVRSRMMFDFGGSYTIPVIDTDVSLSTGFSQWLSVGGDSNGKHAFRWADSSLGFSRGIWDYSTTVMDGKKLAVGFSAALNFTLPTSQASIATHLYTQINPALGFNFKLGGFKFGYQISYSHSFNKYTSQTMDPNEVDVISRHNGTEIVGASNIAIDGVLTEIELANSFSMGYNFLDNLGLTIGLAFADAWSYDNGTISKDDEFTSENAHVGRGHQQISQGTVSLVYAPAPWVMLNFAMISTQPWKTLDNKTTRFPWFDTVSPARNFTKFMIGATFQY